MHDKNEIIEFPTYYLKNNYKYSKKMPIEWLKKEKILTGPQDCLNCRYNGMTVDNIFIHYCSNCQLYAYNNIERPCIECNKNGCTCTYYDNSKEINNIESKSDEQDSIELTISSASSPHVSLSPTNSESSVNLSFSDSSSSLCLSDVKYEIRDEV